MTTGTRSLDVLHIAAAKAGRAVEFLSFDARQRALAALVGLRLAP
jgi:predicted nucleic acid-binding protein